MTTFRSYVFTEMPYPQLLPHPYGPHESIQSVQTLLGNSYFDPDIGYELYNKYFDIYRAVDELGLDIMLNEHHQSAACLASTIPLNMAVIARETKQARILALGNPVGNRSDPVRVAEEMAMIDVLSGGRTNIGLVRGSPEEIPATNAHPVFQRERFWEAVDLIVKAWTTHDGPFSWEGRHFHHRQVNIWPRPYQSPHPPIWITTLSASSSAEIADRDYGVATFAIGTDAVKSIFDAYKRRCAETGRPAPGPEKFCAYAHVFVGDTDEEALEHAKKIQWHYQQIKHPIQFTDVVGYIPVPARAKMMAAVARQGSGNGKGESDGPSPNDWHNAERIATTPIAELGPQGGYFVGNPDTVFEQLRDFYHSVGGFGHFAMMAHCSSMSYDLTVGSMERFSRDVLPRFREEVYDSASVSETLSAAR
jgi:alkanesulfonate monooxygenase SsuD/methylene tetrahydromethanopterin reductase-like flavin-dependent oxidoreductase (luciferase family)